MAATVKVSVTLDAELAAAARSLSHGNLSAFVNDAVAQEVRRERLREALAADREQLGPLPDAVLADVREKWPA